MNRFALALAALLGLVVSAAGAEPVYTVMDLGTLGGTSSIGNGLNIDGKVTGAAFVDQDTVQRAFLSGVNGAPPLRDLGTLGGSESFGQAVNAHGQVVGHSRSTGDGTFRAFLSGMNGGVLTDLGTLGGTLSYAYGVNSAGRVAGSSTTSGGAGTRAFLSDANGKGLVNLGTLPGGTLSVALGVNASGQVTGYSGTAAGFNHAFISEVDGGALRDLGTLGGRFSAGLAINDAGQVTGRSEVLGGGQRAFRSGPNGGPLLDLGTLGGVSSIGQSINSSGAVVGYSHLSDNSTQRAFLYTTTLGMRDLNTLLVPGSGWVLTDARAINDRGQITGVGIVAGQTRAHLLTPVPPQLQITSISREARGAILVQGIGTPLQNYHVEATGDLLEPFERIGGLTADTQGVLQFHDESPPPARRFYRFAAP